MAGLHVHAWGPEDGAAVLAVHGVHGQGGRFRRLATEALGHRRVLAPDLRGHGASPWEPPWDAGAHVADLVAVLDRHGVARADVVGHSFGGLLATRLAAAHPDRVGRLALLDPAVGLPPAFALARAEETAADPGWASTEEALGARLADHPAEAHAEIEEEVRRHAHVAPDGRVRLRFARPASAVAWSEMARPPVALPPGLRVLLVVATPEPYVTAALRSALARDVGEGLDVLELACGHSVLLDAWEPTARAVRLLVG